MPPPSTSCLPLFPWAKFRKTKAAVKLHTLLDLRGAIPSFIHISDGKLHDVNVLDGADCRAGRLLRDGSRLPRLRAALPPPSGRQLLCHPRHLILNFKRMYSRPVDRGTGIALRPRSRTRCILLPPGTTRHGCVASAIAIPKVGDGILDQSYDVGAFDRCQLYRSRWQVELFFKWIKQHLRIKRFFGTSENAVKTQVWIAVAVYVLVAIVRKRLNLELSLHEMLTDSQHHTVLRIRLSLSAPYLLLQPTKISTTTPIN